MEHKEDTSPNGRKKHFLPKEVLYHKGDQIDRVILIRQGLVKLLSYLPNGRARIVRLHCNNHWLGLEGLVEPCYEHTAIAVYGVDAVQIPLKTLQRMEQDDPRQFNQVMRQGYEYLLQADRWIADFSTGEIRPRVARLLEYLAELEYGQPRNRLELLTVNEMAEILGVTPESVSHHIAAFKRAAILKKDADPLRDIYQLDVARLQQEAQK
jgi:CRP/FNR family transcriptional regulator